MTNTTENKAIDDFQPLSEPTVAQTEPSLTEIQAKIESMGSQITISCLDKNNQACFVEFNTLRNRNKLTFGNNLGSKSITFNVEQPDVSKVIKLLMTYPNQIFSREKIRAYLYSNGNRKHRRVFGFVSTPIAILRKMIREAGFQSMMSIDDHQGNGINDITYILQIQTQDAFDQKSKSETD